MDFQIDQCYLPERLSVHEQFRACVEETILEAFPDGINWREDPGSMSYSTSTAFGSVTIEFDDLVNNDLEGIFRKLQTINPILRWEDVQTKQVEAVKNKMREAGFRDVE